MTSLRACGVVVVGLALVLCLPARAEAVSYTFSACMTANYSGCSSLPGQLTVEVTQTVAGTVDFRFENDAIIASSITAIYFDAAGYLTNLSILQESEGVDFSTTNVQPPEAPSGENWIPPFSSTSGLKLDSTDPRPKNGINQADEYLTVRMDLATGKTFDDIIAALNLGPGVDAVRIAAHVQGLPDGQSDTLICCTGYVPPPPDPSSEPASLALFGLAAIGAAYRLRRKRLSS